MQELMSELLINPTFLGIVLIIATPIFKLIEHLVTRNSEGQPSSSRTLIHFFLSVIAALGVLILIYSFLRPIILNNLWVSSLLAIFVIPAFCALIIFFYAILHTEFDTGIIEALIKSFWEPIIRFRKWFIPFSLNHPKATIILMIFVGLIWVTPLALALYPRSQPFLVYIRRSNDPSLDLGMIGNLDAAILQIAGDMKPYDIEVEKDPEDGSPADLWITIALTSNDCKEAATPYRWAIRTADDLSPFLNLFLEENGGLSKEYPNGPCNWIRIQDDIAALILFANGLDRYYLHGQPAAAAKSFREVNKIMGATTLEDYQAENDEKLTKELLRIPRRIRSCAKVMNEIVDGSAADDDARQALTDVVKSDPYGTNAPPSEFCIAQAYYWLGRGALEQHFNALKGFDSDDPDPAKLLEAAHDYLTLAIQTYKKAEEMPEDGVEGYDWIFYFYLGLTSYRQGNLTQASKDLEIAEANYADLPINEFANEVVSYMRARIAVEQAQYQQDFSRGTRDSTCENVTSVDSVQAALNRLEPLTEVRTRSRQNLAIGTMTRFNLALYWAAQEPETTKKEMNRCIGTNSKTATGDPRCKAILHAVHALQLIAGDTDNHSMSLDTSPVDVFLSTLYELDGQDVSAKRMLRNGALDKFIAGTGAPAYVIPLLPRLEPDLACGRATDGYRAGAQKLNDGPFVFRWLLRNSYDEFLFDYQPSTDTDEPGSAVCESTFCVRLDDGSGIPRYWRLNDLGFGLFETGPITPINVVMTARPDLNAGIRMDGTQRVWLTYKNEDENLRALYVGSLPITTSAQLSTDVKVSWLGKDEEGNECSLCYEMDVAAILTANGVANISRLSVGHTEGLADLVFKVALYEEGDTAEGRWRPVNNVLDFQLSRSDGRGRFMGHLSSVELDPDKSHAIRVFVEDRYGNKKATYWSEDIEIIPPL